MVNKNFNPSPALVKFKSELIDELSDLKRCF